MEFKSIPKGMLELTLGNIYLEICKRANTGGKKIKYLLDTYSEFESHLTQLAHKDGYEMEYEKTKEKLCIAIIQIYIIHKLGNEELVKQDALSIPMMDIINESLNKCATNAENTKILKIFATRLDIMRLKKIEKSKAIQLLDNILLYPDNLHEKKNPVYKKSDNCAEEIDENVAFMDNIVDLESVWTDSVANSIKTLTSDENFARKLVMNTLELSMLGPITLSKQNKTAKLLDLVKDFSVLFAPFCDKSGLYLENCFELLTVICKRHLDKKTFNRTLQGLLVGLSNTLSHNRIIELFFARIEDISTETFYKYLNATESLCRKNESIRNVRDYHAKMTCVLFKTLIMRNIISVPDFKIELSSFCLSNTSIREAIDLYSLISEQI